MTDTSDRKQRVIETLDRIHQRLTTDQDGDSDA